jgi:mannose/fructose/N-acetylgalactosamine-specific phosphotransferase system component IID
MDFMKLLKSLDDFLYEVVGWIIFYPITLIRSVLNPVEMLHYSDRELLETNEEQYSDTFNPPIFLLITLFIVYLLGKVIQPQMKIASLLAKDTDLLLFRGVAFSIFPVLMAVDLLRHQGQRIDRVALRPLFYGQCFIAAPFALASSIAGLLFEFHKVPHMIAGFLLFLVAFCWYVGVEIVWFSSTLNVTKFRATFNVLVIVLIANVVVILTALGIDYASRRVS